jgi:hypothetical protein
VSVLVLVREDYRVVRDALKIIGPDIPAAFGGTGLKGFLEPAVLARRVVDHQVDEHVDISVLRLSQEGHEIACRAKAGVDLVMIHHIVASILPW